MEEDVLDGVAWECVSSHGGEQIRLNLEMDLQRKADSLEVAAVMGEATRVFLDIGAWFTRHSVSNWTDHDQQGGTAISRT